MATDLPMVRSRAREGRRRAAGLSLTDVLVSMVIITVLVGLMLPGLSAIRESTRRVVCGSNLRQHALAIAMYADDHQGALAPSAYSSLNQPQSGRDGGRDGNGLRPNRPGFTQDLGNASQQTVLARKSTGEWDGLGWLFAQDYLNASGVFYCPSHHGTFSFRIESPLWSQQQGEVVTNYQYRGGNSFDSDLFNDRTALVTDAMRTVEEFNHIVGANVLRRDLSVSWFADRGGQIANTLPLTVRQLDAGSRVDNAWTRLDDVPGGPGH